MVHRVAFVIILTLVLSHGASAETAPRIRFLDPGLKTLFEHGTTQSPTLRALAEKVEASSVLVFVEGDIRMPVRIGARLSFVTSVNGVPYVHVAVDCTLTSRKQVALLAHELQHALEIGTRPDIVDLEAMESLYEDIGFPAFENGRHKNFETEAAIAVQDAVDEELGGRPARAHGHAIY